MAGGRDLAVSTSAVGEVVALPRLWRPPTAPPLVEGLMNCRGDPVPVIRLARLLGLPDSRIGLFAPVIVFKDEDGAWAALVDRVVDVVAWPDKMLEPAPADLTFNDCVSEIGVEAEGRLVPVLSLKRLLERRERQILTAFRDRALQRQEEWKSEETSG